MCSHKFIKVAEALEWCRVCGALRRDRGRRKGGGLYFAEKKVVLPERVKWDGRPEG